MSLRRAAVRELATAFRFGLVGLAATGVHVGVAWLLLALTGVHPLVANTCAFVVAFTVSFSGHYYWTFRAPGQPARAVLRFVLIALVGFATNSVVLAGLLRTGLVSDRVAIAAALVIVPAITFLGSRLWGFRRSRPAR